MSTPGCLFLIPAPLDFGCDTQAALQEVMPDATLRQAARLNYWICENAKSTRAYLKRVNAIHALAAPIQQLNLRELPRELHKKGEHQIDFDARPLLQDALTGHDVGLVSEAGMPAIADPGSSVVRAAHALGLEVVPMVGPVSPMLALATSGLNGQNFAFAGYLPQDAAQRAQRVRELERLALRQHQTQLFIEVPFRNAALLKTLLDVLAPSTRLAVRAGITLPTARSRSATVADWRQPGWSPDNRTPAVYAIGH